MEIAVVANDDGHLNGFDSNHEIKIGSDEKSVVVHSSRRSKKSQNQLSTTVKKSKKKQLKSRSGLPKRHFLDRIKDYLSQEECKHNSFTNEAKQELQMHLERDITIVMKNALSILDKDKKKITPNIMKKAIDTYCNSTEKPLIQFQTSNKKK
jgi:histone H3/H4